MQLHRRRRRQPAALDRGGTGVDTGHPTNGSNRIVAIAFTAFTAVSALYAAVSYGSGDYALSNDPELGPVDE